MYSWLHLIFTLLKLCEMFTREKVNEKWNISESTFRRVWEKYFPDVKIPKGNRFSKCQTCEELKKIFHSDGIEDGQNLSQEERLKLKKEKVLHCIRKEISLFSLNIYELYYLICFH